MTFGEILSYIIGILGYGLLIILLLMAAAAIIYGFVLIFKLIYYHIKSIIVRIQYRIQLKKTKAMYEKASKTCSSEDSFEKHNDKAASVSSDSFKGYNSNDTSASSDSFAEYNKRAVNDGLGLEVDIVNGSDAWKYEDHDENGNIF